MKKRVVTIYARVSTEHEAQISALGNQIQYYDAILNKHLDWPCNVSDEEDGVSFVLAS